MSENVQEKVFIFGDSDFIVDEFNPEQFLAKYASTCELTELKKNLAEFLTYCEKKITDIMNKDYDSFISLAIRLNGLKEKLSKIQSPLVEGKEQLEQHKQSLFHECEALNNLLQEYQEIERKKRNLSQFLVINKVITQGESVLQEVYPTSV